MSKVVFLFTGFVFLMITDVKGQNAEEDFRKINMAYKKNTSIYMNVEYLVYEDSNDKEVFEKESGWVKVKGYLSYKKIGNHEIVIGEDFKLIVDHDEKMLALLEVSRETGKAEDNTEELLLMN